MLLADELLKNQMSEIYGPLAQAFFADLKDAGFSDEELKAVPSLFLPGWSEGYASSPLKITIAGKETLNWANDFGDCLLDDYKAAENNQYDPFLSCKRFRDQGPKEWANTFWQYSAAAIGKIFGQSKEEVMKPDNKILRGISWFNGHAVETYYSHGVDDKISPEKMQQLQDLADKHKLSDFGTFISVFKPQVILYFYRNSSGIPVRTFDSPACELVKRWMFDGDEAIHEYQWHDTIILNMRHTSWMARGKMTEQECADMIAKALNERGII